MDPILHPSLYPFPLPQLCSALLLWAGGTLPPLDSGLSHVTYVSQWDISRHDKSRVLTSAYLPEGAYCITHLTWPWEGYAQVSLVVPGGGWRTHATEPPTSWPAADLNASPLKTHRTTQSMPSKQADSSQSTLMKNIMIAILSHRVLKWLFLCSSSFMI